MFFSKFARKVARGISLQISMVWFEIETYFGSVPVL